MTLKEYAQEIHANAISHGWWEEKRSFGEIIALCHSELSEALEAYRSGENMVWMNDGKPDGMAVEMIDCVIRILDWFGAHPELDPDAILDVKHEYNKTRSYRHGGKKI